MSLVQTKPAATNMPNVAKLHLKSSASLKEDKIPIVRHIIKDEEIEEAQGEQLEPLELDRIIKLFIDPHSVICFVVEKYDDLQGILTFCPIIDNTS
jgi:hypothetical protein